MRRGELPWWCGKFWLAERWKPGTISSSGLREEVRSMLSCQKKKRQKKRKIFFLFFYKRRRRPCGKIHAVGLTCQIFQWRVRRQHVIFPEFRGSDKEWVHASALEEHQASSSESSDTLTLWLFDLLTFPSLSLCVCVFLCASLSQTHTLAHILKLSHQILICVFQKNPKKNRSIIFRAKTYQLRHTYTISHVWRCTHTLPSSSHIV